MVCDESTVSDESTVCDESTVHATHMIARDACSALSNPFRTCNGRSTRETRASTSNGLARKPTALVEGLLNEPAKLQRAHSQAWLLRLQTWLSRRERQRLQERLAVSLQLSPNACRIKPFSGRGTSGETLAILDSSASRLSVYEANGKPNPNLRYRERTSRGACRLVLKNGFWWPEQNA
jgi:hypothetical protein